VALRERLSGVIGASVCDPETASPEPAWWGPDFREFAYLSTCNRLEVYAVSTGTDGESRELITTRLAEWGEVSAEELEPHVYCKEDAEAVSHLLRVACGLDSQMLGETQIQGQVLDAFAAARSNGTCGPMLSYLFSRAAHAGKRARAETDISRGGTSISQAAVTLLEKELGDLSSRSVLVAGAGETAELVVQALHKRGAPRVCCVNRTLDTAQALAARFGCEARPWGELASALLAVDAVITATSSPHAVIYADDVAPVLARRQGTSLVFVDIAVPRDVDLEVGSLPGVVLHDIDQLEAARDRNLSRRSAAVPDVEEIVARETQRVMEWLHGREAADLLAELREYARSVADIELKSAIRKLKSTDKNTEEVLSRFANRIVGKLLHQPTKQLKARALSDDFEIYCDAVVDLFGLEHQRPPRPAGPTGKSGSDRD
jgi:glutamyl-tRNA reductase